MQIVMTYCVSDGCTFSYTETVPIEYESLEAAIVDFEAKASVIKNIDCETDFMFAGQQFNYWNHFDGDDFRSPDFMTVDEWFKAY